MKGVAARLFLDLAREPTGPLIVIAVVVLLLLLVLYLLARRALRCPAPMAGGTNAGAPTSAGSLRWWSAESSSLRASFHHAMRVLRRLEPGAGGRYRLPWFLMVGQAGAGKTALLSRVELPLPYGEPDESTSGSKALNWWFFDRAVVLDPPGDWVLRRDGRTSDDASWRALLGEIRRHRPRRPLDGVIVTLSAAELLAATRGGTGGLGGNAALAGTAQRASLVDGKLVELQTYLGCRVPVYLVVTQTDHVEGFDAFVAAESGPAGPHAVGQQIFGWSTPFALDAPYSGRWITEAFAAIERRLGRLILRSFGSPTPEEEATAAAGASDLFLFPRRLASLQQPVLTWANHLFAPSALAEPNELRGLFFTGALSAGPRPRPDHAGETPADVLFGTELLRDKVFPEAPVARPTPQSRKSARRKVAALALAMPALLLGAALVYGVSYAHLETRVAGLQPLLTRIEDDLKQAASGSGSPQAAAVASLRARELLAASEEVGSYHLRSPGLPASWPSPLDRRLREAVRGAWEALVFPALNHSLEGDLVRLAAPLPEPAGTPGQVLYGATDTAALPPLARYVQEVAATEDQVDLYGCVVAACRRDGAALLQDFRALTRRVWGQDFRPPAGNPTRFYGKVLAKVRLTPLQPSAEQIEAYRGGATRLTRDVYGELFESQLIRVDLTALQGDLDTLERAAGSLPPTDQTYRDLDDQIAATSTHLKDPRVAWVGAPRWRFDPILGNVFTTMDASAYLGRPLSAGLQQAGQRDFSLFQSTLAAFESEATGPYLAEKNGRPQLELSAGVQQLETALATMLGESFAAAEPPATLAPTPDGAYLDWNADLLAAAPKLVASYETFLTKGLGLFPASLRSTTGEVALATLNRNLLDLLARAQRFPPAPLLPEERIRAEVAGLSGASAALAGVLQTFDGLGLAASEARLSQVLGDEELPILRQLEGLLLARRLYHPQDPTFSEWSGEIPPPLAYEAFDVTNDTQLKAYVTTQREAVASLVDNYAKPVVSAPRGVPSRDGGDFTRLLAFWETILADLEGFDSKTAGNPVTVLETFITSTMKTLDLESCFQAIPAAELGGSVTDYFLTHEQSLAQGIHDRCVTLATEQGLCGYQQMAEVFTNRLANRFPFGVPHESVFDNEATPASVRAFFTVYDAFAPVIGDIPAAGSAFGSAEEEKQVRGFLAQMAKVRDFFAPFLDDPKDNPVPRYGLEVEFRVDRQREAGAEEILRWELEAGEARASIGGAKAARTLLWTFGEPMRVTLGWAQNSPAVPVGAANSALLDGRTVQWLYANQWSLLALVAEHRTGATATGDPAPVTLRFLVETLADPPDWNLPTSVTMAFDRLTVLTPDQKNQLTVPTFPTAAPALTRPPADCSRWQEAMPAPPQTAKPSPAPSAPAHQGNGGGGPASEPQ